MRMMLCSCAALGAGGWAVTGAGPDFDRTVNRSPVAVYAAFSSLSPAVVHTIPRTADTPELTARVVKSEGSEIRYEVTSEGKEVVSVVLGFEEAKGGAATRVTAELDIDQPQLRALAAFGGAEEQILPANMPEPLIDMAFQHLMQQMTDDVEAGRPIEALGSGGERAWRTTRPEGASANRSQARMRQHEAARPMNRAAPTMDPNEAARAYREGESGGGWGR